MYQVIARTWRPQKFSEVIGQKHVTETLQNAIRLNRIGHGYIFSGQRGTGKTTVARLLAKALNCHRGPAPEPCGECDSCREITLGRSVDVIEIDAASNRGIDAVRELRENARYAPARDRYKVFIIDEAHQITTEGFNALLKTLEEPPPHVIFLLATTEVHQFPETILSRCQHFSLHALKFAEILSHLEKVCAAEKVQADAEALAVLAKSGQGSLRDALSRLEQAMAAFGERLEGPAVRRFLGEAPSSLIEEVFGAIKDQQRERILQVVESLVQEGYQLIHFCSQMVATVRNLLVIRVAGPEPRLLELSPEETERLTDLAKDFSEETLMRCLEILLQLHQQLRFSMDPRFQMELGLLKLVDAEKLVAIEDLLAHLDSKPASKPESKPNPDRAASSIAQPGAASAASKQPAKLTPWEQDQIRKRPSQVQPAESLSSETSAGATGTTPSGSSADEKGWIQAILGRLEQEFPILGGLIANATGWQFGETEILVRMTEAGGLKGITEVDRQRIEQVCSAVLGRKMKVSMGQAGAGQASAPAKDASPKFVRPGSSGPATHRVSQDPQVAEFEQTFGKRVKVTRDWKE